MKNLKSAIKENVRAYLHDNEQYIRESGCKTVAEYLLSSLNQDSDYWWYLESDGDDNLSDE
ncbi:MAG: hypothetical protein PUF10_02930 [Bacteroidales bacterium]|nr:hypothetical protein [Bacteroidales bacterium]